MNKAVLSLFVVSLVLCSTLAIAPLSKYDDYQKKRASEKMEILWSQIMQKTTPYKFPSTLELLELFTMSMNKTMDVVQDTMPKRDILPGLRPKLVHSVGPIAKAKWISTGNHSYTGVFKGSDNVLIRYSAAAAPSPDNFTPGFALKFLIDGVPSTNTMAMYSLLGQKGYKVFVNDFSNHVPDLPADAPFVLKQLKSTFSKASKYPIKLGLGHLATWEQNGNRTSKPVLPFQLVYKSYDAVKNADGANWINTLTAIQPQKLYHVYARANPKAGLEKIADLEITTKFTPSEFGDRYLFFQHYRMEEDFKLHPEWKDA